jgi:hypothetical protein
MAQQTLNNGETFLSIRNKINANFGECYGFAPLDTQSPITYTPTVTLDFNHADAIRTLDLTGDVTFAAVSNKAATKQKVVIITAGASTRNLTFPAWTFIGAAAPTSIAANKTAVLSLYCSGTTEASIIATYSVQP